MDKSKDQLDEIDVKTEEVATNFQRIKAMDVEQLAALLFYAGNGDEYCAQHCAYSKNARCGRKCREGVIEWLNGTEDRFGVTDSSW